jgi:predicted molibdopterin-dependent oxidoreductase YjgC
LYINDRKSGACPYREKTNNKKLEEIKPKSQKHENLEMHIDRLESVYEPQRPKCILCSVN